MTFREVTPYEISSFPYTSIGLVLVTWADGTRTKGSAAVVGVNDILTAAHVIYNPDRGGWAEDIDFYFGADYNDRYGVFENYGYTLPFGFRWQARADIKGSFADGRNDTFTDSESQSDIALIGVSVEIGNITGWLGLDPGKNYTQIVNAAGYPAGATGLMTERVNVYSNSRWDVYEGISQMDKGSSGGPLFTDSGHVIGVRSSGSGPGTSGTWADLGYSWHWIEEFLVENNDLLGLYESPKTPKYILSAQRASINEGETVIFYLSTTDVAALTSVSYKIDGVQASDIEGGSLGGFVTIGQDGKATISITTLKDALVEGDETLHLSLGTAKASVLVRDAADAGLTTSQSIAAQVLLCYLGRTADKGMLSQYAGKLVNGSPTTALMKDLFHSVEGAMVFGGAPTAPTVLVKAFQMVGRTLTPDALVAWSGWIESTRMDLARVPWEVMQVALSTESALPPAEQIAWKRLAVAYALAEKISENASLVQVMATSADAHSKLRVLVQSVTTDASVGTAVTTAFNTFAADVTNSSTATESFVLTAAAATSPDTWPVLDSQMIGGVGAGDFGPDALVFDDATRPLSLMGQPDPAHA